MRPIVLKGHERSITHVQYNRDGDLLFSSSKDKFPTLWHADTGGERQRTRHSRTLPSSRTPHTPTLRRVVVSHWTNEAKFLSSLSHTHTHTAERIGTYNGHTGAVWHLDVDYSSQYLLSGAADMTARLWHVESGELLATYMHDRPVRGVAFQHGPALAGRSRHFVTVSDQVMGTAPKVLLYRLPAREGDELSTDAVRSIVGWSSSTRITTAAWGPEDATIIVSGEDGMIVVYDAETGSELRRLQAHSKSIRDLKFDSQQQLFFMTASVDTTAKIWDTRSLELMQTYDTGRSINCCSISSSHDHVALAGGQEAVDVALTRVDPAQFHTRIWHRSLAVELGQIPGHFGPVNTVSYSPDGKSLVTAGEDGYIRIHHLDATEVERLEVELN
jgi:translation initiation factor 3 subunit I